MYWIKQRKNWEESRMNEPIISLKNISFAYEDKPILEDVILEINHVAFMKMYGTNTGGKTNLIKIILGQVNEDQGTDELVQQPLSDFNDWTRIEFDAKKANAFNRGFPATVFEVVSMGLTDKIGYFILFKR